MGREFPLLIAPRPPVVPSPTLPGPAETFPQARHPPGQPPPHPGPTHPQARSPPPGLPGPAVNRDERPTPTLLLPASLLSPRRGAHARRRLTEATVPLHSAPGNGQERRRPISSPGLLRARPDVAGPRPRVLGAGGPIPPRSRERPRPPPGRPGRPPGAAPGRWCDVVVRRWCVQSASTAVAPACQLWSVRPSAG